MQTDKLISVFSFFRTLTQILYYTIVLSVATMSGNPFLNFFLQALIELPGFLTGRAVCDRLGRRWSQAGAFLFAALFQVACLLTVVREYNYVSCLLTPPPPKNKTEKKIKI